MSTATARALKGTEKRDAIKAYNTGTIFTLPKEKYGNVSAWTKDFDISIFEKGGVVLKISHAVFTVNRADFEAVLKALGYIVPEVESPVVKA